VVHIVTTGFYTVKHNFLRTCEAQ